PGSGRRGAVGAAGRAAGGASSRPMATTKEELVSERPPAHRMTRRTLLKTAAAGAAVGGFPWPLRAQPRAIKVAAIHCVTGPLAEPGQACRLAAQIAADAINQAGGIKSMGGARFEL